MQRRADLLDRRSLGAGPLRRRRTGRQQLIGGTRQRRTRSAEFAHACAAVLGGAGLGARLLPRALPTPVLAFAVRHLGTDAGIMVTASHNPPGDNGLKVYLADGAQLVGPADAEIEAAIRAVGPLCELPHAAVPPPEGAELVEAYVAATAALSLVPDRDIRVVATAMHGVGRATLEAVFARAGLAAPEFEPSQAEPDPDFPTVAFPNPEEPGALDRVLALAERRGADLVVATDPDADRCAVAVAGLTNGHQATLKLPVGTYSAAVALAGTTAPVIGPADVMVAKRTNTIVYAWGGAGAPFAFAVQSVPLADSYGSKHHRGSDDD